MRKKGFITCFLLLALTTQAAVLVDDFESYTAPGSITSPWVQTDGSPTFEQEASGNQCMESYGSYLSLDTDSIPDTDTATTAFYRIYKSGGTSPDCSVGLSDLTTPTGDWGDFEAYVSVVGNDLRARNGSSNTSIMTISDAAWYNIWLVINNSTQTYDVYVTTDSADATAGDLQANDYAFRTGNGDTPVDLVTFKVYGRDYAPIRVDDIYISNGVDLSIPSGLPIPIITSQPEDITANETQSAVFETVFTSVSTPSAAWYKVATPTDLLMDPAETNIDVQLSYDTPTEQYTATLSMTGLMTSDAGQYYCKITNDGGSRNSNTANLMVYGLVAHWTLDQDSYSGGNYLEEVAGNDAAVNGTPTFVTGADGTANGATQITASDGWALAPVFDPIQQSGQMTISFWANRGETSATEDDLIAESTDGEMLTMSNGLKADSQWQHICTVFDGTTGKLYVDGLLQDEGSWALPTETEAAVNIGVSSDGLHAFNGSLDDMRLYNYALTDTEVADLRYALSGESSCILALDATYDLSGPDSQPDCVINIFDLVTFANRWLTPPDNYGLSEFADLASTWQSSGLYPNGN